MGRVVGDDRKATVTQITTRYNRGMQNTISERTTRPTLKQMKTTRYQQGVPNKVAGECNSIYCVKFMSGTQSCITEKKAVSNSFLAFKGTVCDFIQV